MRGCARRAHVVLVSALLGLGRMVMEDAFERQGYGDIEERANHLVPRMVTRLKEADEHVVSILRERPIATLCVAVAVGYVVGRIFSRA